MTRALITDPDLPAKAAAGRAEEIVRCIGCNVCIAHYHAGTPIVCAMNPRTGRERSLPRPSTSARRRRLVVVGAGPAGLAAAAEATRAGHEVVVLERNGRAGGQMSLAGWRRAAPRSRGGSGELPRPRRPLARRPARRASRARAGRRRRRDRRAAVPAGPPARGRFGRPVLGRAHRDRCRRVRRVVVADWGGDPSGLDAAEVLRAAGRDVTLAVASVAVGETLHQYRRNLYLQRLYRAGVAVLAAPRARRRRPAATRASATSSPAELETALPADLLVLALGRVPEDRARPRARRARPGRRGGRGLPLAEIARGGDPRGHAGGPPRVRVARVLTERSRFGMALSDARTGAHGRDRKPTRRARRARDRADRLRHDCPQAGGPASRRGPSAGVPRRPVARGRRGDRPVRAGRRRPRRQAAHRARTQLRGPPAADRPVPRDGRRQEPAPERPHRRRLLRAARRLDEPPAARRGAGRPPVRPRLVRHEGRRRGHDVRGRGARGRTASGSPATSSWRRTPTRSRSGAGALALVERGLSADAGIVTEPTAFEVWVACRGSSYADVTVPGRPGHAELAQPDWRDGGAVNAIEKALGRARLDPRPP